MENKSVFFQMKNVEKLILRNLRPEGIVLKEIANIYPTPTQMQIVGHILDNIDKDIYQKNLEDVLNLRRATVSGVLQTMEKKGLIERIVDEEDTRTKKIVLKAKAKDMFEKNKKKLENLEKIATKDISEEELRIFSEVINKMINNIEKSTTEK